MNIATAIVSLLNEEHEIVMQRDNTFALITWRDFNAPAKPVLSLRAAACMFILAVALPMLVLV